METQDIHIPKQDKPTCINRFEFWFGVAVILFFLTWFEMCSFNYKTMDVQQLDQRLDEELSKRDAIIEQLKSDLFQAASRSDTTIIIVNNNLKIKQ